MIGKRTARDLTRSLIPTRLYLILAGIAVVVAVSMWILAILSRGVVPDWLADEFYRYAQTFRAMPPWFLIGGSLTQFAGRLNVAVDDAIVWLRDRKADYQEPIYYGSLFRRSSADPVKPDHVEPGYTFNDPEYYCGVPKGR